MANGKIITKILIDGKEFFDNDIDMALKNLPAAMVNKLQIFKDQSETSKITGFKDGDTEQVINLTIKEEYKRTFFGNGRVGYGTDDRYSNKLNANYLVDKNQYALAGNMNNVTDDFEYSGLSGQYDGITKNQNIGVNFNSQRSEKLQIGGNIRYNHEDNLFAMDSNTTSFIEDGSRISQQKSDSRSISRLLETGYNLKWKPDSLTTLNARLSISTGTRDELRHSTNQSHIIHQNDTTSGYSDYYSYGSTHNLSASVTFGRKLNAKGRTITLSLNGNVNGRDSDGFNKSVTHYQETNETKLIDQILDIEGNGKNYGLKVSYVEPLGRKNLLMLSYSYRSESSSNDKLTYIRDGEGEYTAIDSAYTRNSSSRFITQRFSIDFQSSRDKFEYTVGFNIDPSYSKTRTNIGELNIENQRQHVVNVSPTFRFSYNPDSNTNLDFEYSGSTQSPSLRQLSSDTIIIDALSRTYGNPKLKPAYRNDVNVYFMKSNYEKGSYFTLMGGGNYTANQIADYTITDKLGNTETTYRNAQGNWGLNGGLSFSMPLKNKKLSIDNSSYGYLMSSVGFANGRKAVTKNLTLNETATLRYRSEKLDQSIQGGLAYNITRSNFPGQENLNVISYSFKSSTQWELPYNFSIQNEISYTRNNGYADDFKKSELLWNLSIAKQFLKKKNGTLKLQCYDLFDDRNNVLRVTSANYMSDTRTNMIGRYVLLSFNYSFNFSPKGSNSGDNDTESFYSGF
jgi:hypothetical protein